MAVNKTVVRSSFYMDIKAFYCIVVRAISLEMQNLHGVVDGSEGMHVFI